MTVLIRPLSAGRSCGWARRAHGGQRTRDFAGTGRVRAAFPRGTFVVALQMGGRFILWIAWLIAAAALGIAEAFTLTLAFGLLAAAALLAATGAGLRGPPL